MIRSAQNIVAAGIVLLCGCGGSHSGLPANGYAVIVLNTGSSFPGYHAGGINGAGLGVGGGGPAHHAFFFDHGTETDLGVLPGADWADALAINGHNQAVGYSTLFTPNEVIHACTWQNGTLIDLNPATSTDSRANAINDSGQIVGCTGTGAILWDGSQIIDLDRAAGTHGGCANGINNRGQIVGFSYFGGFVPHACVWQDKVATDLDSSNRWDSSALAINDAGQIVGYRDQAPFGDLLNRATLWKNGTAIDLGILPGTNAPVSTALGINNKGAIVGFAGSGMTLGRGFIYQNGVMRDLNSMIPQDLGYIITSANGINDKGQIIAGAWRPADATGHVVLLVPR